MKSLILSGVVEYLGKNHTFSFKNSIITLHERIQSEEIDSVFPPHKFSISELFGYTNTGVSVSFIDCVLSNNFRKQEFSTNVVVLSNKIEINRKSKFNSLRMTGGSLNNFGDVVREIFSSNDDKADISILQTGVCNYKARPFTETDYKFTDISDSSDHYYRFSSNRHFLLTDKNISDFNRSFEYRSENGFTIKDILKQVLEMINFIKLISWKRNVSIDRTSLGVIGEDNLNYPTANVYFNLPKDNESIFNVSLLDYNTENNAMGTLYANNKNLQKSHVFLLSEKHSERSFDSKDILNCVITYEQIIDHFDIPKCKMLPEVKVLRKKIIKDYSHEKNFETLKDHLNNFRGINLKETVKHLLDKNQNLVYELVKKSSNINCDDELLKLLYNVIDFRNKVVHTSEFDITIEGLADGAFLMTYINYYIILIKSDFEESKAMEILNKVFDI